MREDKKLNSKEAFIIVMDLSRINNVLVDVSQLLKSVKDDGFGQELKTKTCKREYSSIRNKEESFKLKTPMESAVN